MTRTVRDAKLESRTARRALKMSGKPYYRAIDEGLHLGYRKNATGGKWVARWYDGDGKYATGTIGAADDNIDADGAEHLSFAQAQAAARALMIARRRAAQGDLVPLRAYTVADCMTDYLDWLEVHGKSARDARRRSNAAIIPKLGKVECAKLTAKQLRDWRDAAANEPPRIRTKPGQPQKYRTIDDDDPEEAVRRRRATVNRVLTTIKAALNRAWQIDRKIASDDAWRSVKPFAKADAARIRYLTIPEARKLIAAADPDLATLIRAALATGCRYSELGALYVSDFNPDSGTLHIRTSKGGKGRHVVLTEEGIKLFAKLAKDRAGTARMLTKTGGGRWLNNHQSRPMIAASAAAELDPPAGFHALRHTYASLSIMNGAPLMVVARNMGHADTRMVEKHYGHLSSSYVADAIRAAAPRFDTSPALPAEAENAA